jgi:cytoskeletal protein RodZ
MTKERTYQIIIAILVIVILVGGLIAFRRPQQVSSTDLSVSATSSVSTNEGADLSQAASTTDEAGSSQAGESSTGNVAPAAGESVSVADQPAGMSVSVGSVTLNQSTWIAIRDSEGRTLGAALFPAGSQTDVSVPLLRATTAGESYQALLYVDDGDKQFDLHKDAIVTGESGNVVGSAFSAN